MTSNIQKHSINKKYAFMMYASNFNLKLDQNSSISKTKNPYTTNAMHVDTLDIPGVLASEQLISPYHVIFIQIELKIVILCLFFKGLKGSESRGVFF